MAKVMIVTVGTSLFHSASWDENNKDFLSKLGCLSDNYRNDWAQAGTPKSPGNLARPDMRKSSCPALVETFKQLLTSDNVDLWKGFVTPYSTGTTPMRYSAELATIISYANLMNTRDWQAFLSEYEFVFVFDSNENNLGHIAGVHIGTYLEKIARISEEKITAKKIQNFSDLDPNNLTEALREFREFLLNERNTAENEQIDLIVTGGYKIYGFVSYGTISPSTQIIYMHEDASLVFIHKADKIIIDDTELNLDPVV